MKKLLLGSVSLLIFSLSIFIFQISCKKDTTAQTGQNAKTLLNRILIHVISNDVNEQLRLIDYDGLLWETIPLTLPNAYQYVDSKISPDQKYIFINASDTTGGNYSRATIFRMNIDGSNLKKIYDPPTNIKGGGVEGVY